MLTPDELKIPLDNPKYRVVFHAGIGPLISLYISTDEIVISILDTLPLADVIRVLEGAHMLMLDVKDSVTGLQKPGAAD